MFTFSGRHNSAIGIDTIDFKVQRRVVGVDDVEYQTARNFSYFCRIARNVARLSRAYLILRTRRVTKWGLEPEINQLEEEFGLFIAELPTNLSVVFPPNGSTPFLPSSFIGNMNSYHHLSLLLLHRSQLTFLRPTSMEWKYHITRCYESASAICRLQEAIVDNFGLEGLQCMQRGYSFTIYAGLSCIILYMVSPFLSLRYIAGLFLLQDGNVVSDSHPGLRPQVVL